VSEPNDPLALAYPGDILIRDGQMKVVSDRAPAPLGAAILSRRVYDRFIIAWANLRDAAGLEKFSLGRFIPVNEATRQAFDKIIAEAKAEPDRAALYFLTFGYDMP
jgi:hypothetical protein